MALFRRRESLGSGEVLFDCEVYAFTLLLISLTCLTIYKMTIFALVHIRVVLLPFVLVVIRLDLFIRGS